MLATLAISLWCVHYKFLARPGAQGIGIPHTGIHCLGHVLTSTQMLAIHTFCLLFLHWKPQRLGLICHANQHLLPLRDRTLP